MKTLFWILLVCIVFALQPVLAAPRVDAISASGLSTVTAGNSFAPRFSADGRFLFFGSDARNLVTNKDLSLHINIFRHELLSRDTLLVSTTPDNTVSGNGN